MIYKPTDEEEKASDRFHAERMAQTEKTIAEARNSSEPMKSRFADTPTTRPTMDELDPFETWFASLTRVEQSERFKHSMYMREAWNAAKTTHAGEGMVEDDYVLLPKTLTVEIACALEMAAPPPATSQAAAEQLVADYAIIWSHVVALSHAPTKPAPVVDETLRDELALTQWMLAYITHNGGGTGILMFDPATLPPHIRAAYDRLTSPTTQKER